MSHAPHFVKLTLICLGCTTWLQAQDRSLLERQWPHWRGPLASGVAPHANPPLHWDTDTEHSLEGRSPRRGQCHADCVAGPRVCGHGNSYGSQGREPRSNLTPMRAHSPPENYYQFVVICLRPQRWRYTLAKGRRRSGSARRASRDQHVCLGITDDGRQATCTCRSVLKVCSAIDLDGNLLWQQDLGQMRTRRGWGEAVTPVIHHDTSDRQLGPGRPFVHRRAGCRVRGNSLAG